MDIKDNLNAIVNAVKDIIPLREAYLFGSYAYGEPSEYSDYDIYFVVDKIDGRKHDLIVQIYDVIENIKKKPVDIILNTKHDFDYRKGNQSTLEYVVVEEGVKLYG